jgi:hypothetical protein
VWCVRGWPLLPGNVSINASWSAVCRDALQFSDKRWHVESEFLARLFSDEVLVVLSPLVLGLILGYRGYLDGTFLDELAAVVMLEVEPDAIMAFTQQRIERQLESLGLVLADWSTELSLGA